MITHNPLHGSGQAGFPHPALALGEDAYASQGIGMTDGRQRQPASDEAPHAIPKDAAVLATPRQRAFPKYRDVVAESHEGPGVRGHRVVRKEACDHLLEPSSLFGNRPVHPPPQLLLDRLELRPHAVAPGLPFDQEATRARCPADEGEAQEIEGLRFAQALPLTACRRVASELDQPGLLRVQRQRERPHPLAQLIEEAPGIGLVLETDNEVVGIAHNDHVARGLAPSPAFGPEIEDVEQVDVGKQR